MNYFSFSPGDLVEVIAIHDDTDTDAIGKRGRVARVANFVDSLYGKKYWTEIDVPGRDPRNWFFYGYQLKLIKENDMNTADKLFNSKLSEDEKTLRESGLKDERGRITPEGVTALMDLLYGVHGKELAAAIRELQKKEKKES